MVYWRSPKNNHGNFVNLVKFVENNQKKIIWNLTTNTRDAVFYSFGCLKLHTFYHPLALLSTYMATSMINYPTFCIFRFFESENLLSDTQERITARLRAELSVSVTYLSWQMMVKAKKVKLFGRKGLLILQQASHTRLDLINWRKLLKKKRKGEKKNLYSSIHKSACFHIFSQTLDCIIALL